MEPDARGSCGSHLHQLPTLLEDPLRGPLVTILRRTGLYTTAEWASVIPAEGQRQRIVEAVNGYAGAVL